MKKTITFLIACFIGIVSFAQNYSFTAYQSSIGYRNSYGSITWDSWGTCWIPVSVSDSYCNGVPVSIVKIYTEYKQSYICTPTSSTQSTYKYKAVDEEGNNCEVQLRITTSGDCELYIFWSDMAVGYKLTD